MSRVMRRVKVWFKRMEKARANRLAVQELEKFSDRDLQDLGIGRCEIRSRVYGIK